MFPRSVTPIVTPPRSATPSLQPFRRSAQSAHVSPPYPAAPSLHAFRSSRSVLSPAIRRLTSFRLVSLFVRPEDSAKSGGVEPAPRFGLEIRFTVHFIDYTVLSVVRNSVEPIPVVPR